MDYFLYNHFRLLLIVLYCINHTIIKVKREWILLWVLNKKIAKVIRGKLFDCNFRNGLRKIYGKKLLEATLVLPLKSGLAIYFIVLRQSHLFERATTPKLIKTKKIQKRKDFGRRNPNRDIFKEL